jgi:hypothetical protein
VLCIHGPGKNLDAVLFTSEIGGADLESLEWES